MSYRSCLHALLQIKFWPFNLLQSPPPAGTVTGVFWDNLMIGSILNLYLNLKYGCYICAIASVYFMTAIISKLHASDSSFWSWSLCCVNLGFDIEKCTGKPEFHTLLTLVYNFVFYDSAELPLISQIFTEVNKVYPGVKIIAAVPDSFSVEDATYNDVEIVKYHTRSVSEWGFVRQGQLQTGILL